MYLQVTKLIYLNKHCTIVHIENSYHLKFHIRHIQKGWKPNLSLLNGHPDPAGVQYEFITRIRTRSRFGTPGHVRVIPRRYSNNVFDVSIQLISGVRCGGECPLHRCMCWRGNKGCTYVCFPYKNLCVAY